MAMRGAAHNRHAGNKLKRRVVPRPVHAHLNTAGARCGCCTGHTLTGEFMFKPNAGDAAHNSRVRGYLHDAMQRWKFLTEADCLDVGDSDQLAARIASRHGLTAKRAAIEVGEWKRGKQL
jgi:hypothetical protein